MMKILCLYPDEVNKGGQPRYPWVAIFGEMSSKYGIEGKVISFSQIEPLRKVLGAILFFIPRAYIGDIALFLRALPEMRRYDFIFAWYGTSVLLGIAKYLLRLRNPKLIVLMYRPLREGGTWRKLISLIYRTAFRQADKIVCINSSQVFDTTATLGIPTSRVKFVRMAIDTEFYAPVDVEDEAYLLCPGDQDRDEELLLELSQRLPYRIVRVTRRKEVAEYLRPLFVQQNNVIILHNVPFTQLRALYAKARVVILPLKDVDHPAGMTALLEAMAMGKVVIVTAGLSSEECAQAGAGVTLVDPGDSTGWEEAILRVWEDKQQRDQLGKEAQTWVEQHASIPKSADEFFTTVLSDYLRQESVTSGGSNRPGRSRLST